VPALNSRVADAYYRWCTLDARDRVATAKMVALVFAVSVCLRIVGFHHTRRMLRHFEYRRNPPIDVARRVKAVRRVRRNAAWAGRCLSRSLALQWVLRRDGIPAQVHIAVHSDHDGLRAHAWVVLNGVALDDGPGVAEPVRYGRFILN